MFSHRIKNAIQFGVEAGRYEARTGDKVDSQLQRFAEWLDSHPTGSFDQYVEELEDAN